VVIAIIAILAALLLPSLQGAKAQAKMTYCANNLHEIEVATTLYVGDNQNCYPYIGEVYAPSLRWEQILNPYYPGAAINRYPTAVSNPAFQCPCYTGLTDIGGGIFSYAYNIWGAAWGLVDDPAVEGYMGLASLPPGTIDANADHQHNRRESEVAAPGEMFGFMDANGHLDANQEFCGNDDTRAPIVTTVPIAPVIPNADGDASAAGIQNPPQHGKYFNVSSPDGHVAKFPWLNMFYNESGPNDQFTTASHWNIDNKPHPEFFDQGISGLP